MKRIPRCLVFIGAAVFLVSALPAAPSLADKPSWRSTKTARYYDKRYGHDRSYVRHGHVVHRLPPRNSRIRFHDSHYYYGGGIFYRPYGLGYVVVPPPIGVYVPWLPPGYVTLYVGAVPYYYANLTYYVQAGATGYRVVEEPTDVEAAQVVPAELFVYPKQGQSEAQLATDRYECHAWATRETGYDPSLGEPLSDAARSEYHRAMTACLEARGYSVK